MRYATETNYRPKRRRRLRFEVQEATETTGAHGTSKTWSTVFYVRASLSTFSMLEKIKADALQAEVSHRAICRYDPRLTVQHRLKLGSRIFYINGVDNVYQGNRKIIMILKEDT